MLFSDQRQDSSGDSDEPQPTSLLIPPKPKLAPIASCETLSETSDFLTEVDESESDSDSDELTIPIGAASQDDPCVRFITPGESSTDPEETINLTVPMSLSLEASSETLTGTLISPRTLSAATSSDTLVGASPISSPASSPGGTPKKGPLSPRRLGFRTKKFSAPTIKVPTSIQMDALALSPATSPKFKRAPSPLRRATSPVCTVTFSPSTNSGSPQVSPTSSKSPLDSPKLKRAPSPISYSLSSPSMTTAIAKTRTGIEQSRCCTQQVLPQIVIVVRHFDGFVQK